MFTAVAAAGMAGTVRFQWDQPVHRFVHTLNPARPSPETKALSSGVPDSSPAAVNFKQLAANDLAANCMSRAAGERHRGGSWGGYGPSKRVTNSKVSISTR